MFASHLSPYGLGFKTLNLNKLFEDMCTLGAHCVRCMHFNVFKSNLNVMIKKEHIAFQVIRSMGVS